MAISQKAAPYKRTSAREDFHEASAVSLAISHLAGEHLPTLPHSKQHKKPSKKIVLPTMEGLCFEKVKYISHLEASGNYTLLHFMDGRQVLVCRSLCEIESQLPPTDFVRIHRSHTVHMRHLEKYVRGKGGHVELTNGTCLNVSAGQKDFFLAHLKNYFN